MDVDRFSNLRVDKENNQENWLAFNRAQGARMSAMEHLVPEQMFSTEEAPANGISAVKAIQLAAAEGQKIYTITQQNLSIALQQLQLSSEIKADISNAVSAGMEVTAHQQPVNFFGSLSVGYILLDPNTGAGAYRIGGGENGGFISSNAADFLSFLGLSLGIVGAAFSIFWLIAISVVIATFLAIELYLDYAANDSRCDDLDWLIAGAILATLVGALISPLVAIILAYVALLAGNGAMAASNSTICKQ